MTANGVFFQALNMRFDSLNDWLAWQEDLHPVEIDLGLDRVNKVSSNLGLKEGLSDPSITVITVAGTNGKGSCVAMLDAILRAAGYRVGTYTSPHLFHYNERIHINGVEVEDGMLCNAFEQVDQARADVTLSYFEFGTLAALYIFGQSDLDVVILEVGLGGRLDAVNIVDADLAIISSIDIDHTDWLGDDREQIGKEKAGIFRAGKPAVCGDNNPPASILQAAESVGTELYTLNDDFTYTVNADGWTWKYSSGGAGVHNKKGSDCLRSGLPLPSLRGRIQVQNAASVVMALELVADRLPVSTDAIRHGLHDVKLNGRFQVLPGKVTQILDVAHNPEAARILHQNLQLHGCSGYTYAVIAMLKDKDVESVIDVLSEDIDGWYVAGLPVNRGMDSKELATRVRAICAKCSVIEFENVEQARSKALQDAHDGDRLLIFGSFYTVAQALQE